jgi:hypothetical protein
MVPFPGLAGEACLLQLPDAVGDEPEAVLPGGFVAGLDRVACVQRIVAVHLDCAEIYPCVKAVWQIGRGNGPQPLSGLKNLTVPCAMTAGSRVSGAAANGFRDGVTLIDWISARVGTGLSKNTHSSAALGWCVRARFEFLIRSAGLPVAGKKGR